MKRKTRRRPMTTEPAPAVYYDALLRTLLVVEHVGGLWLVPRRPGGWSSRQRLTMTDAARAERLTPASEVTAAWLAIE